MYGANRDSLIQRGYTPIPLEGKRPLNAEWNTSPSPAITGTNKLCNVGIVTGRVIAIDIDIEDADLAQTVADQGLIGEHCPMRVGRAPRRMYFARAAADETIDKMALRMTAPDGSKVLVEILGCGQQFAALGIHPDTGKPFEWFDAAGEPIDGPPPLDTLPEFTADSLIQFLSSARDMLECLHGCTIQSSSTGGAIQRLEGDTPPWTPPTSVPADLAEALDRLDADEYDSWIATGMALKAHGADWTFDLWNEWSKRSLKYTDRAQLESRWQTFKPHSTGLSAIARAAGCPGFAWEDFQPEPTGYVPTSKALDPPKPEAGPAKGLLSPLLPGPISLLDYLVDDFLETGATGVLWGDPGTFKSFLAFDWGMHVAHGDSWRGHKVEQGPVWIIAGEGERGLRRRLAAWNKRHGYDLDDYGAGVLMSAGAVNLSDIENAAALVRQGRAAPPKLIVIDTLSRNFEGDENAQGDVRNFLDNVTKVGQRLGSTVLIVHHSKKDGENYRGSSVIKGNIDFEYELKRLSRRTDITLINHKMKDAEPPPNMAMHAVVVRIGTAIDKWDQLKDVTSLVLEGMSAEQADVEKQAHDAAKMAEKEAKEQDAVLRVLAAAGGAGASRETVRQGSHGLRKEYALEVLRSLVESGRVSEMDGKKQGWKIYRKLE